VTERIDPVRVHVVVWLVLVALAVVNVGLALLRLGAVTGPLIAAVQALLIVMFSMHLRWSPPIVRVFALAGLVWMSILIAGTMDDVLTRAWLAIPGK
jgi:cytochrome c oxidase subunit 4